ncbi:MAG: S41 family peptidase [Bacillota bacterium]
MNSIARKSIFKILTVFILVLVGTNLATYLVFADQDDPTATEDDPSVIRFEPDANQVDANNGTEIFWEALEAITNHYFYPVDKEELMEGAVRGMIEVLDDPQLRFYDPDELEEFKRDTKGVYGGIGIRIIEAESDIVVFETFADTPAERNGLVPGDRILEADGNELTGEGIDYAAEIMRGPSDTSVVLTVQRPGAEEPMEMTVIREEIQVSTVSGEMMEEGLGYIEINGFDSKTADEFFEVFETIEKNGLSKGLVLDLRNNSGGLVDQAVTIAEQFVPEGEIVRLVGQDDQIKTVYQSEADKKPYPIVVLVNEESASSAELLAGAMQDRNAATLVGQTTYGKASVQQLEELPDNNALMLTVANYFTPSGRNIDKYGIEPDYEVEMPEILRYYHYFHPSFLEEGDYGSEVEMLQEMLELLDYEIDVNGYFDEMTSKALTRFQVNSGIESSGEFDDKTWVKLREALDMASREQDKQLKKALELLEKPELWENTGGNN